MRHATLAVAAFTLVALAGATHAATPKLHGNNFYANCKFSHANDDDPIVYPNQPGKSHPHTFFGNATPGRRLHAREPQG